MADDYRIDTDAEWERARRALLSASTDLQRDLERALDLQVDLTAADAAREVTSIPTTGKWGKGIRRRIAAGLRVTSHRIPAIFDSAVVTSSLEADMSDDDAIVAKGWERASGWDHPVYGYGEVHQQGHPWLYNTVRNHLPLMALALKKVLDNTADHIEHGRPSW